MCGIVGILRPNQNRYFQQNNIKRMISTLLHRGPDSWGFYLSENIALGHTRLSIVDLSGGNQPMVSERYSLVYNGELFNYIELRKELINKGAKFNTKSDTEVVLKAFEIYGIDSFSRFNGQFAIMIWDKQEKKLIIARDRYGIRPLYILKHKNGFYFASEMKAFDTIDGYKRNFERQNLFEHALLWNTLDDSTIFANIRTLPAGTFEIYNLNGSYAKSRYYEIGESQGVSPRDLNSAIEEFTSLLNDSVKLRLRSDVPVAAYLSGGIDSSVITCLTKSYKNEMLKTFSVSFADNEFDESNYQKEMVEHINSDHFRLEIDRRDINDNFLDAVYHFERPVFRTAGVPLFLLSKEVNASGIKVVLTGEGADEILFGYDSFKEIKLLEFWNKFPESKLRPLLIKQLYPHLKHYQKSKQFGLIRMFYEGFLDELDNELASLNIRIHNNKAISNYFNKDYNFLIDKEKILEKIKLFLPGNFYSWSSLQKNQFLEMKTLLSGYLLSSQGDRMSLAHGVEGRYPFLDHRIVEKLFYYDDKFKLNGFSQKHLLCEAFKKTVPLSIIKRPKRPYISPDLESFFYNNQLSEQASFFLSGKMINDYGIFDEKIVNRLIKKYTRRHSKGIGYRDNMLITFILSCQMVEYWIRNPKINKLDEKCKTLNIVDWE